MNFTCPICNYDFERFFTNGVSFGEKPLSVYSSNYIECPHCKSILEGEYDESWDGHEEIQYFYLTVIEEK